MSIFSRTGSVQNRWRSASPQRRKLLMAGILSFSSACTLTGIVVLFTFDQTAGAISAVPDRWPSSSEIRRNAGNDTLLVFVHPQCSCTVATLHEIATLGANRSPQSEPFSTVVLFDHPSNTAWLPGNLWTQVEREIPGVHKVRDDDGREARRFGARTSGYAELFNARGELLFKGGVTGSRGHEGDNLGIAQLRTSIDTGRPAAHASLVFGCALSAAETPLYGEDH
jgi:hypothetical protein